MVGTFWDYGFRTFSVHHYFRWRNLSIDSRTATLNRIYPRSPPGMPSFTPFYAAKAYEHTQKETHCYCKYGSQNVLDDPDDFRKRLLIRGCNKGEKLINRIRFKIGMIITIFCT